MKKFIVLAVLASSTAFAAESGIYDIQYLPTPGTTYGFTTVEMGKGTIETDDSDTDIDGYIFTQTFGHAFTDRFSLEATLNYANLEADPEGRSSWEYRKGVSDPTISARFRMMDENFRWDLLGGALIGLSDKESDVDSEGFIDGQDNLQGGNSVFIGTQIGVKSEYVQWALLAQLTHNMKADKDYNFDDGTEDIEVEDETYNELLIRGDLLNKLAEKSYLRTHILVNFTEEIGNEEENIVTPTPTATLYEVGAEYQHLIAQDFLARVGVDYWQTNQRTGSIDTFDAWIFRIGGNYEF